MISSYFEKFESYHKLEVPLVLLGGKIKLLGWFSYSSAQIKNDNVKLPREVYKVIEDEIREKAEYILDNKIVLVFRDLVNFGTDDFALQLKDCFGKVGNWEDVIGYGGRELKTL